jgi:hypothetical protein
MLRYRYNSVYKLVPEVRSSELTLMFLAEIAKVYGSHTTTRGLQHYFTRDIKPNVKLLLAAKAGGRDGKEVVMINNVRDGRAGKR